MTLVSVWGLWREALHEARAYYARLEAQSKERGMLGRILLSRTRHIVSAGLAYAMQCWGESVLSSKLRMKACLHRVKTQDKITALQISSSYSQP